ncbi:10342_t:CDS:2 [Cetraspora pellucida]|uniref:10342_t:CDS:1 n=1 Tax=Cetraspora pellucida TaxID=1433469 RepID=A0ACA9KKK1_9GLOM|nr:10342_t:CDS:2 [Cetraspora pellucida]
MDFLSSEADPTGYFIESDMLDKSNSNYETNNQLISDTLHSLIHANQLFFENEPQEFISSFNNNVSLDSQLYEADGSTYSDNDYDTSLVGYEASDSTYSDNSCNVPLVDHKVNSSTYTNNGCSAPLVNNSSSHYSSFNDNIFFSNGYNIDDSFSNLEIGSSSSTINNAYLNNEYLALNTQEDVNNEHEQKNHNKLALLELKPVIAVKR